MSSFSILENTYDENGTSSYYYNFIDEVIANDEASLLSAFESINLYNQKGFYLVGYISYELHFLLFDQSKKYSKINQLNPLLHFVVYKNKKEVPHQQLETLLGNNKKKIKKNIKTLYFSQNYENYKNSLRKVQDKLRNGESYQINYTSRYNFQYLDTPISLYFQLRKQQPARFCAFLPFSTTNVLSFSPELFFQLDGENIMVKPMKGTHKRSTNPSIDKQYKADLQNDKKVQSENLIIVDLLRNDLSKIAETGSVNVNSLFEIEEYKTLYQMTSTICAKLRKGTSFAAILKAIFPCGSITGAPKLRTIESIQQLEDSPRNIYTGAIGSISPNGNMCFNVAIRTIQGQGTKYTTGVGGGITIESNIKEEWNEMHLKALYLKKIYKPNFQIIESFQYSKCNGIVRLKEHIHRLINTAHTLQFTLIERNQLILAINNHVKTKIKTDDLYKIRLSLSYNGNLAISSSIVKIEKCYYFIVSELAIDESNILFQYKTTSMDTRGLMDKEFAMAKKSNIKINNIVFKNSNGYISDALYHNIIVEISGKKYTPKISDGSLPGIYRQMLINDHNVIEKSITLDELNKASKIWFCNDVRGMIPAFQWNRKH